MFNVLTTHGLSAIKSKSNRNLTRFTGDPRNDWCFRLSIYNKVSNFEFLSIDQFEIIKQKNKYYSQFIVGLVSKTTLLSHKNDAAIGWVESIL